MLSVATALGEMTVVRMLYGFTSCSSPSASTRARQTCSRRRLRTRDRPYVLPQMLLLIVKLNRDFHRAGDVQRSDARIYLRDDDDAGLGNFLAALAIVNRNVRAGRPVGDFSDFVCVRSLSFFRDRSREVTEFFAAEQIIHCECERQLRNEIAGSFIVG